MTIVALSCRWALADQPQTITIFDSVSMQWTDDAPMTWDEGDLHFLAEGQAVQRTVELPAMPSNHRDTRGVTVIVEIKPIMTTIEGAQRPGDPWTRMGTVGIVTPPAPAVDRGNADASNNPEANESAESGKEPARLRTTLPADQPLPGHECEMARFITGFGAPASYEQDVTALLPLLSGRVTLRLFLSTWESPGWHVTVRLRYEAATAGARRPAYCAALFHEHEVTAAHPALRASVTVPQGMARPRMRIISTGHATDGTAGDEFATRMHVLKVDGREVARWRPWSEAGGQVRGLNPWAGRRMIDGRAIRSSDFDRSGWTPGLAVEPLILPLEELSPGTHQIELTVRGVRPKDESGMGYWFVSAAVVADEPWPAEAPAQGADQGADRTRAGDEDDRGDGDQR